MVTSRTSSSLNVIGVEENVLFIINVCCYVYSNSPSSSKDFVPHYCKFVNKLLLAQRPNSSRPLSSRDSSAGRQASRLVEPPRSASAAGDGRDDDRRRKNADGDGDAAGNRTPIVVVVTQPEVKLPSDRSLAGNGGKLNTTGNVNLAVLCNFTKL